MFRFLVPTILIGLSIAIFFTFTSPVYQELSDLRTQASSYDEALTNSKELEDTRDALTTQSNDLSQEDIEKLEKLLPDNVDNIRLILEIEKIATPYGMSLKDVRYDSDKPVAGAAGAPVQMVDPVETENKDYGTWELEFSTSATYNNFLAFLKDLESNLRIVDISSVSFTSDVGLGLNNGFADVYKYNFKIKTYWLKN